MPSPDQSLIAEQEARDAAQPVLFSLPDVEAREDQQGKYTAERLFLRRPEMYRTVVRLMAEGHSLRSINRLTKLHHYTICAVATREGRAIEAEKEEVIAGLRAVQVGLVESIIEDVHADRLKPGEKTIALGIVTDKIELLTGGATQRIDRTGGPSIEEWNDYVRTLRAADATVVEMGFGGGNGGQRASRTEPRPPSQIADGAAGSGGAAAGQIAGETGAHVMKDQMPARVKTPDATCNATETGRDLPSAESGAPDHSQGHEQAGGEGVGSGRGGGHQPDSL